jgi:hypothetical protein
MKKGLILGIAATSLLAAQATASQPANCGGKCGTGKIYSQTKLQHDPNGVLARARHGEFGLTGKGYKVADTSRSRLAEGVCGR